MRWIKYLILILTSLFFSQCNEKLTESNLELENIEEWTSDATVQSKANCIENLSYVPDTTNSHVDNLRYIRMNIHFMNSSDWKSNYNGEAGRKYANDLLYYANRKLVYNKKMKLPVGNDSPACPIRNLQRFRCRYSLGEKPENGNDL